ncbi:hypothetical protein G6F57_004692 [Rhizopus arrhizus]|uniref:Uncharacterized protein n=1 Tax=Rhizopus oryzae TaxID=64495 RepID=A0A9P6XL53_RHIOR|nr:hypothetical protein G6F23_000734 [Rhizopus arrhizus]KAG1429239.1 hypothetical protein G6F58_000137 [Rhizopus delemar]KAG0767139.1 hypothetical protein G6F24_003039 [Rhizopus arrhizus]KAG0792298.1 hypothetical protein G6F21_004458 [Rhizopus arrhizus]KAG0802397.1 hypothetical protein G6F22_000300 [Rhizopus arrhizus]
MIVNDIHNELAPVREEQYLSEDMARKCSLSSISSPIVDIQGQAVTSDILVALLDRPAEMKQLVSRNSQFYEAIQRYITETQGEHTWKRFQDILYKPREKLPDRAWISRISHYLVHNSVLFSKFKEIVGYAEDIPETVSPPFHYRLSASSSTGSSATSHRRSRRLSNKSFDFDLTEDDSIIEEEAPEVPEGMFTNEEQFYQQTALSGQPRRRRSSCHDIYSEPHPTFVESKIDEVDEAEVENNDESDHLSELLDDNDDDNDDDDDTNNEVNLQNVNDRRKEQSSNGMDFIKLRDHPEIQTDLPKTHPAFFRKAKQLLSLAPSSRRFSATMRRNSILEDDMPSSPMTEMDEPRLQTCSDSDEEEKHGDLVRLICRTRRQQPDDIAWFNDIMEALSGWPELIDGLNDIANEVLNGNRR